MLMSTASPEYLVALEAFFDFTFANKQRSRNCVSIDEIYKRILTNSRSAVRMFNL